MKLCRAEGVRTRDLENGDLTLMAEDESQLILLNNVGAAVWELCDGTLTGEDIVRLLVEHFSDAAPSQVEKDVVSFVKRLKDLHVLREL